MQGPLAKHTLLVRSLAGLDPRDPSLTDTSLINTIPAADPLVDSLGGGDNGGVKPPSPGQPPGNSPPGNPHPGTTSTVGSGDDNGNHGGNTPTNSPTPTSGGGAVFQPASTVPTKPTSASTPGNPASSPSTHNVGGGSTASSSSLGASAGYPVSNGGGSAMAAAPSSSLGTSPVSATNLFAPSQSSLGSGSNTAALPTTAAATSSGGRLSGGAIGGITILCLFALFVLVLMVVRRRSIARRMELRKQWWFNRSPSRRFSSNDGPRTPMEANGEISASRLSARSSFATNFDQGLMFRVDLPLGGGYPDYPPMAEVRERNPLVFAGATLARSNSIHSVLSTGSDSAAQYLAVSTAQNNLEPFTPMSVRPFSPSESFFFPKPPAPSSADTFFLPGTQGHMSSQSSVTTLVQVSAPPPAFMADNPPTPGQVPSLHPQILTPSAALSPVAAAAYNSPFAGHVKPELAGIGVIRRPFAPSLDDELLVYPGDHVRIFQAFDDGWALVEKLSGTHGMPHEAGLIPIDCLREADQPLTTFLAQKRVSYGSDQQVGCAL